MGVGTSDRPLRRAAFSTNSASGGAHSSDLAAERQRAIQEKCQNRTPTRGRRREMDVEAVDNRPTREDVMESNLKSQPSAASRRDNSVQSETRLTSGWISMMAPGAPKKPTGRSDELEQPPSWTRSAATRHKWPHARRGSRQNTRRAVMEQFLALNNTSRASCNKLSLSIIYQHTLLLLSVALFALACTSRLAAGQLSSSASLPDEISHTSAIDGDESAIEAEDASFYESSRRSGSFGGDTTPSASTQTIRLARQSTSPSPPGSQTSTASVTSSDDILQEDSLAAQQQQQPYDYHSNMPVITKRELANAIKQAIATVDRLHSLGAPQDSALSPIDELHDNDISLEAGWLASSMFHKPAPDDAFVINQTRMALIGEEATRTLAKQYKLNRQQTLRGLPLISVDQTPLGKQCPRPARSFSCIPGRYRSLSGHCNNVQQPDWGSSQTPLIRYAPARYTDNISRPPRAASTPISQPDQQLGPLPSARQVSVAVYEAALQQAASDVDQDSSSAISSLLQQSHSHMTTMLSFFGQFVFHDLAFVPQFSNSIKCCRQQQATNKPLHAECMPIELKSADGTNFCLDYVRSVPASRNGCNLGLRDQLNLVSSFLDGSVIYGSSEAQMSQLRSFSGGRLRSQRLVGGSSGSQAATGSGQQLELLPQIKWLMAGANETDPHWWSAARDCLQIATMRRKRRPSTTSSSRPDDSPASMMEQMNLNCFQAGDTRVNENIGLTLMHTIWLREHNLVADKLAQLNRHWQDQRLFEEARRIVVAELQQITYNELLPSILGDEVMQRFNLTTLGQGYSQAYDPALNPGVSNEVASAVFPFILATIPSALERYSGRLEMLGSTSLADTFMDGSDLFKRNKFAQYLTGMMSQNAMEPALGLVPMTMRASEVGGTPSRNNVSSAAALAPQLDAVALTIQQGRDHGLQPYLHWRRVCQLKPTIRSWTDLAQVMPRATVERLRQVYADIEQLDLFLALLEEPAPGATLGPTFVCLLARQFYQLKHGDRYWFENDLPGIAFTPKQLDEIRQTSLAKVMCRNSQASISFIQPSPMLASDPFLNAYQYCTNKAMDDLDVGHWRQPVNSAQQVADEQLADELVGSRHLEFGNSRALQRGKRMITDNIQMISERLNQAKSQLDSLASRESAQMKSAFAHRARRSVGGGEHPVQQRHHRHSGHSARGYRYLPRPKRQALSINNQSVILELATNEVVRSLLRQGKDRERPQSVQNDIRDFLYSLESIQLDNLLDNSASSDSVEQFIASANSFFLTEEQRLRLAASGDATLSSDPLNEILSSTAASRSSSISMNCQDDDRAFPCDHTTPFRTITGWCNNLQQPKFGQSFTLHDRILPNAYQDGLSKPRQLSVSSTDERSIRLPSARLISTTMHDDRSQLHVRYSLALMQFGQFGVDHDLTRTPFSVALDGTLLDCSACDSQRAVHRDCLPIEVPDNDAHFQSARARSNSGTGGGSSRKCLHFVRSLNGQRALGPRQQLNALTAYLDASQVYGSDNCEAKSLRAFAGGRLNASAYPVAGGASLNYVPREILPVTRQNPECVTPSGLCFHAGDQRASEQPGLTAIHTIFMRLHNSIVDQLASLNRHWNDEKLYQQGRRIVGAILQRITYNEFAPRLLGLDYMSKFNLMLKQVGYSDNYDDSCSASILTEFASAAFRMGHSLIRGSFPLLNRQYKQAGKALQLRTAFFNSDRILSEPQLIDQIMRGIVTTPIETLDNSITEELTNHLFEKPREPFSGMDLISLNIQRARDHGIPGYNRYRQKCNLTRARTFDELAGEIPQRLIKRLSSLYASVDDIDLFTGGVSEMPVHGGIVGPTFGCIIGMQLSRLKRCDRFWHETSDPFVRFSAAQLAEIRKITLAKVICSQSDLIDSIQRQAMDVPDKYLNPRLPCASLPSLDLGAWRENQKSCLVNKIKIELGHSKRVSPCRSCTCTLEGPICRTAKINCLKMMQKGSRMGSAFNQIMADKSCLVQCAWALDMQPQ